MFCYISGKIIQKNDTSIILLVNNIGYKIELISKNSKKVSLNQSSNFYIYQHTNYDNQLTLIGFLDYNNYKMFKNLMIIPRTGLKTSIKIINNYSLKELKLIVKNSDVTALTKINKISDKQGFKIISNLFKIYFPNEKLFEHNHELYNCFKKLGYKKDSIEYAFLNTKKSNNLDLYFLNLLKSLSYQHSRTIINNE